MDHLVVCIEQLDRATEELAEGSAIASRLSLILIDNVIELTMHRCCEDIFRRESASDPDPARPGRYSRVARARVLGQRFDEKLKFMLAEGRLSQQELEFVRACHDIRGEAYHTGLTHDGFMRPLASEYHTLACKLMVRFQPEWRSSRSGDKYGDRLQKHLRPGSGHRLAQYLGTPIEEIVASLESGRPTVEPELPEALADNISARLDGVEENLQYLVDGIPSGRGSREKELVEAQRWSDLFSGIPLDVQERTEEYGEFVRWRYEEMAKSWQPKVKSLPIGSWRTRADRIRGACQNFCV